MVQWNYLIMVSMFNRLPEAIEKMSAEERVTSKEYYARLNRMEQDMLKEYFSDVVQIIDNFSGTPPINPWGMNIRLVSGETYRSRNAYAAKRTEPLDSKTLEELTRRCSQNLSNSIEVFELNALNAQYPSQGR